MSVRLPILLVCLTILIGIVGCQPDNQCHKENIVEAQISFRNKALTKVSLDSVTIQGVGSDSVIYNNKKSLNHIALPLHKTQEVTQFVFSSGTRIDTLTLEHTNTENFISLECGCFVYHTLQNAYSCGTWIDSVAIINTEITTFNAEDHIQLFFD